MDYNPHYPQPFTFTQALQFDVNTIVNEITRLERSLEHLVRTQSELDDFLSGEYKNDGDLIAARRDNETVIASQRERISMLKLSLEAKGINSSSQRIKRAASNVVISPTTHRDEHVSRRDQDWIEQLQTGGPIQEEHSEVGDGGVYL